MSRQIQIRRGTTAQHSNFTGAIGEVTMDTIKKTLRVHDGETVGGNEIMSSNQFFSNVTNCITKIPQDLNFELAADGTLTLKSGSKIYVPNGSGVFDTITTSSDLSVTRSDSQKCMVYYNTSNSTISVLPRVLFYSGATAPTAYTFMYWYDTSENKCKFTSDSGSNWVDGKSLPLCVVSTNGSKISAIDQIFNGFGFVGSTVFVLPGVSGLIPAGVNADGTLKHTLKTTSSVITRTGMGTSITNYSVGLNVGSFLNYSSNYTLGLDGFLHIPNGTIYNDVVFGEYNTGSDGRISFFKAKGVFQIADSKDSGSIAHQAMPGKNYVDLTLGASGTTYTAPADGFYAVAKGATTSGQYITIISATNGLNCNFMAPDVVTCRLFLPVSKGDVVSINYTLAGTTALFRFIYANGAR